MTAIPTRPRSRRLGGRAAAGTRTAFAAAALLLCAAPSLAAPDGDKGDDGARRAPAAGTVDVLVLRDGRRLEGAVVAEDASGVTFRCGGSTRFHAADAVERVERGAAPANPAADPAPGAAAGKPAEKREPKERDAGRRNDAPLSAAAERWIGDLVRQASSEDEQVRRSVAAALRALGPAAAPAIRAAAESASEPRARELLERVGKDLASRRPGPGEPKGEGTPEPGTQPPNPERPENGKRPPDGRPGRGAALERIAAELELREEQRPGFARVLGALERESQSVLKEVRQGGLAPKDASAKLDEIRARTATAAAEVLDPGQVEAFRTVLDRYVAGQLDRAAKAAGKPPQDAGKPPEKAPGE